MPDGPPPNVRSLLARLRNHCRATGLDQPRVQRHLAMMVVAQFLEGAVIKGGRSLEVRYGLRATRASIDLDVSRTPSLPDFLDDLEAAPTSGWQGFTGSMRERGMLVVPLPEDRRPHRLDIITRYRGSSGLGTVRLEIVRDEDMPSMAPDVVESRDASELFAALGLPPPDPVRLLPVAHQIAQKLHACTVPDEPAGGHVNERAHDLIDLQILVRDVGDDGFGALRAVSEALFESRGGHAWPPIVSVRAGWADAYRLARRDMPDADIAEAVEDAVRWLGGLVERIASS